MNFTKLPFIIVLVLCGGCANKIIEVESKEGERAKIHINTPYEPCKVRGKHSGAYIKCKWDL